MWTVSPNRLDDVVLIYRVYLTLRSLEFSKITFQISVPISKEPNSSPLQRSVNAIQENILCLLCYLKAINTFQRHIAALVNITAGGTYSNHCVADGNICTKNMIHYC
jgi:hypothetical protein